MAWVALAVVLSLLGLFWLASRAPTCTCNKPDCGGGCRLDR